MSVVEREISCCTYNISGQMYLDVKYQQMHVIL